MLCQFGNRSLIILLDLNSLLFSLFIEDVTLLCYLIAQACQLSIQTFNFLVLPLLLLGQDFKVKFDIGCVIRLETAYINLVL